MGSADRHPPRRRIILHWNRSVWIQFIALVAATILSLGGHVLAGRMVGLSITAFCSAMVAYFLMTPVYSLRVSQPYDVAALALYGSVGLALARTMPSKRPGALSTGIVQIPAPSRVEADLEAALADVKSCELGVLLRAGKIKLAARTPLFCTHAEAVRILSVVFDAAFQDAQIQQIYIYAAPQPEGQRLFIAAHHRWPVPAGQVIVIGRRDADCQPAQFPEPLPGVFASWFDNGYARIYQVSIPARTHEPKSRSQLF